VGLGWIAFERMIMLVTIQSGPIGQLAFGIDDGVGHHPKWALDEYPLEGWWCLLPIP
jgi:hypothetical protein